DRKLHQCLGGPGLQVPAQELLIAAKAEKRAAFWRQAKLRDEAAMTFRGSRQLGAVGDVPQPRATLPRRDGGERLAVRIKIQAADAEWIAPVANLLAAVGVPQSDGAVAAAGGEQLAVRRKRHGAHGLGFVAELESFLAGCHVHNDE